ncbi:MAG: hypothetical protein CL453_05405 [Acidimicrobiaceae bacterium]|nr:hypothetical protein [Acidimicrobiaceae bacterium]
MCHLSHTKKTCIVLIRSLNDDLIKSRLVLCGGPVAIQTIPYYDRQRDWRELALCKDTSPELFFPIGNTGSALDAISLAKNVCSRCPSQIECLEYALDSNQDNGVWGGRSEEERRLIRKQRRS